MPLDERNFPDATLDALFTYHPPTTLDAKMKYERLRLAARVFSSVIVECCPVSADRTVAVRKLRECVMTANASIALEDERAGPGP